MLSAAVPLLSNEPHNEGAAHCESSYSLALYSLNLVLRVALTWGIASGETTLSIHDTDAFPRAQVTIVD